MGEDSKMEERKRYNAPFLAACKYLMQIMRINQGQLSEMLGTNSSHFSDWKNGKKRVSQEKMQSLLTISKGKINRFYLSGQSPYMLLENLPDEDLSELQGKEVDPDYELLEKRKDNKQSQKSNTESHTDQSSLFNAALAAQIETIANLKQTIFDMKEQHKRELAEKDSHIADLTKLAEERLHRIAELRRALDAHDINPSNYPFTVGVADSQKQKRI